MATSKSLQSVTTFSLQKGLYWFFVCLADLVISIYLSFAFTSCRAYLVWAYDYYDAKKSYITNTNVKFEMLKQ